MKKGNKRFWRAPNQIFSFRPFIFSLKNNKFWSTWRLEPPTAHIRTVFQPAGLIGWVIFKNYGDFLFHSTNYAFDCCKWLREAFLPFFLLKKIKSEACAQKGWQTLHVCFFLIAPYLSSYCGQTPFSCSPFSYDMR